MQLIVRVTNRCNFKCEFCSASNLSVTTDLPLQTLIDFVIKYQDKVTSIAFEGGDPLCISPTYYYKFFEWKDSNPHLKNCEVSFTTNLWDFYKRPHKWKDLFLRDDVDIGTSFQYGTGRRISANVVYDEDTFIDVFNKTVSVTGKRPGFITVIDESNQDTVIKTALLAKRLETVCKINPLFQSGKSKSFYSWDKMLLQYAQLFELHLDQYELNCKAIKGIITNQTDCVGCPLHNRHCDNDFRVINPDGYVKTCSMDSSATVKFYNVNHIDNINDNRKLMLADSKCLTCDFYRWCNYCRIKIREYQSINDQQQYCKNVEDAITRITQVIDNDN